MRVVVGVAAAVQVVDFSRIITGVLEPSHLRLPYVPYVTLTVEVLPFYLVAWTAAALLFAAGWHTRVAGMLTALMMFYALFLDQQTYANGLYLVALVVGLLALGDAGAVWSLDARRQATTGTVPAWAVALLKLQVTIVYTFTALAKVNLLFLSGVIIRGYLRQTGPLAFPAMLRIFPVMSALSFLSIAIELFLATALWSKKLRGAAVVIGIAFHLVLTTLAEPKMVVGIGVFSAVMFALYLPFFEHTPHRVTVYFDDDCGICTRCLEWLLSMDKRRYLRAIGTRDPRAFQHPISTADASSTLIVFDDETGERKLRSQAFSAIFTALGLPFQPLRLLGLPGFSRVADVFYNAVARHRHQISTWLGVKACVVKRKAS